MPHFWPYLAEVGLFLGEISQYRQKMFPRNGSEELTQMRIHRDFGIENLRDRTALLRGFRILLECRGISTRHLADHVNVTRCNCPSGIQFVQRECYGRRNTLRS